MNTDKDFNLNLFGDFNSPTKQAKENYKNKVI